jgi:hypothetical protein
VTEDAQLKIIGTVLVLSGLIWLWFGDKEIPAKGGRVVRLLSASRGTMKWMKWPLGLGLIYLGVEVLRK